MLPLSFAQGGDKVLVTQVGGSEDVKQHLGDLGFVPGAVIRVISAHNGDLIVDLKGTKLAITREMASRIKVNNENNAS
ncbi:MAG: FeoA family protein [Eubacteriales bacterium]|jgi:ferrous iron transport protein A